MSAAITSLTPNQVNDELNKMQAFIKKEAQEKAKEIQLKADQEYEISKSSIVRSETANIDVNFNDKMKKILLKQQISKSTISNKMRLKTLNERELILNDIFDISKTRLKEITKNDAKYKSILKNLILESVVQLLQNDVKILVLKKDKKIVTALIPELKEEYKKITKEDSNELNIVIDEKNFLNGNEVSGGCIIKSMDDKISIDNTLEERLKLLNYSALPAIRLELFGPTKTRKFFD